MQLIFEKITSDESPFFSHFEERYLSDFPEVERREVADLISILKRSDSPITLEAIIYDGLFAGFISYWLLPNFIYLEHFAIDPSMRSKGLGRKTMIHIQERYPHERLLLEVEPPVDDLTTRRIGFYERMGFTLSDHLYVQPPYRAGGESIPLRLMTMRFANPVGSVEVEELKQHVYDVQI